MRQPFSKDKKLFNLVIVKGIPIEFKTEDFKSDLQVIKDAENSVQIKKIMSKEDQDHFTVVFDFQTFQTERNLFSNIIAKKTL